MTRRPLPLTSAENDYRAAASRSPSPRPTIDVVIPVYDQPEALASTLAGLVAQTYPYELFSVVVADDGSEKDIPSVVGSFEDRLSVTMVRQERDGFGLARARNLGARHGEADVLLFLDADCIPDPDLLERHAWWHRRAANLVVAGSRVGQEGVARGAGASRDEERGREPDDWRRVFYRRTKRLLLADAAFRAATGSNLSVRREWFLRVAGFSEAFRAWGGEDTELGWRLWNAGLYVVPENRAIVTHQDAGGDGPWREAARARALPLVADLVPNRFYRKAPNPLASVPKVSWVVAVETADDANRALELVRRGAFQDVEVVLHGPIEALESLRGLAAEAPRVSVVDGFERAVWKARGEFLALADGRIRVNENLLSRLVERIERDARVAIMRVAYQIGASDRYRRLEDLGAIDTAVARRGPALFALVRRRELLKDAAALADPAGAWAAVLNRSRTELIITDAARLPEELAVPAGPGGPSLADLKAIGVEELARVGVRKLRAVRAGPAPVPKGDVPDPTPRVEYVGFTGTDNLGDEAALEGIRSIMPSLEIARDVGDPHMLMLGGGTLVNGNGYYLTRILRNDSPTLERAIVGVGVRSPEFFGVTERVSDWWPFFESAVYVGVRGPDSVEYLRELGYDGDVEVFGDPALTLRAPGVIPRIEGRIVVCPAWARGILWGGDDAAVLATLAATIRRLRDAGHDVVLLSAFPGDDRWIIQLMRDAGAPDLPYVAGYGDLEAAVELLASAELVIAERLHAAILAAANGTPFVGLEYWPKHRDFARSIDRSDVLIRTDALVAGALDELVDDVWARRDSVRDEIALRVNVLRESQRRMAVGIVSAL